MSSKFTSSLSPPTQALMTGRKVSQTLALKHACILQSSGKFPPKKDPQKTNLCLGITSNNCDLIGMACVLGMEIF